MKITPQIWLLLASFILISQVLSAQNNRTAMSVANLNGENYSDPFAGGMNAIQFGEIDMNMDGIKDLLAFDRQGNRIMPYINSGIEGTIDYSYAPEYISGLPELYHWAIFIDYNMDGKEDIFTYNPQFPGIIIYKNTSTYELRFELVIYPYLTSWYGSGYVNILVTYADYPGISDLDGDGDLDILTFWALGAFVEMHKNLSMETYGHADSLIFERTTWCWGEFAESEESNDLYLDTCFGTKYYFPEDIPGRERHTGSTFLLTDLNDDGTKDLLLGDVDYPQLIFLLNDGTSEDAYISEYYHAFPDEDDPSWIYSMPAAALVDVNNDGADDLLVSPFDPNPFVTQNHKSVWLYINAGSNAVPDFEFETKRFLQQDMIDCGSGAYPVFADINLDGLQDLIIGNYGYYKNSWYNEYMALHSEYASRMAIFMNVGEDYQPRFEYITDDFGFIQEMNILGAYPTFGDIDSDDDADMVVGRDNGTLLFYRNCSCIGNPEDFALEDTNYKGIDVGDFSTPFLYDIDEDGLIDLIIGERGGNLNFYKNTGDLYEPEFTLVTDSLGKVLVTDFNLSWDGYSTPYIFRAQDGKMRLVSGSEQGIIYYYTDIENNLLGSFTPSDELWKLIDSVEFTIKKGYRTSAAIANLNGDAYMDMLIGNFSGGLNIYSTGLEPEVSMDIPDDIAKETFGLQVYPNPANRLLNIRINGTQPDDEYNIRMYNLTGRLIFEDQFNGSNAYSLNTSTFPGGIYLCSVSAAKAHEARVTKRIIIRH